ncbi:MAG: hypothetical protein A2Z07_10570 [Armatimonadetes bacterium RBG_16_67_12]|nr:MAG: hypothetical protein A2Z07_10570 [Armatimonadetes bacterium RBG_16_67_12]
MRLGRWLWAAPDGLRYLGTLSWLHRSQYASPERMRAFQEARLRHLAEHAYARTVFYRQRFDEAGVRSSEITFLEALQRVPLVTRYDILNRPAEMRAGNARHFRPETGHTSGTTGARLEFLRDQQTIRMANAAMWRFEGWHGARWRHRRAEIRSIRASDSPTEFLHSHGSPTLIVNITSSQITPQLAATALAEFNPEVIVARSPAWLAWLSLYLVERRPHSIRPRVVFTRGEQLFAEQRQAMTDAFGVQVVDVYATHEFLVFGGECTHGRMHLASEMGIVEILKDGRAAAPGEVGSVVLTSLWNHAFPFIRYDIGDIACMEAGPCPCGRTLPTWRLIGGRQRDLVAVRSGYMYVPAYLLTAPHWRGKIIEFQFFQESREGVAARIVRGPAFTDSDTDRLRSELSAYFKGELDISIEFLDSIGLTAGGKFRFVVSRVPLEI